jgi:glycosyltransferase involved in cell wall biosynthesis
MSSKGAISLSSVLSKHPWALTVHSVPPYERKLSRWHGQETLHYGARALRFALNSLVWRWIFSRGLLPLIIVHSEFVQNIVIRYGAAPNTVHLIPLPFDAPNSSGRDARIGTRTQNPLLVTVAGFAHTKGQHDAVKALPGLIRIYPKIQYQMIGEVRDNGYLTYLRDLAGKFRIREHLLISPDLDNAAKLTALESADVYIQPSHEEGFCLAYAEAAAIVPRLVGTDAGAIAAMSRADAGARIVPIKDPSALGAAVVELLTTDLPMNLMNLRSQRLSREFSLERYLADHEKLYAGPGSRS